jgi:hypothetical protein
VDEKQTLRGEVQNPLVVDMSEMQMGVDVVCESLVSNLFQNCSAGVHQFIAVVNDTLSAFHT